MMRSRWLALIVVPVTLWALLAASAQAQEPSGAIDTRALFRAVGNLYDLDPDLLAAIARVESGNDPLAVSSKGARGLMQLMPATARRFRVEDSFDPVESALGAARFLEYLRWALAAPDESADLPEMLAAYNAGEGAVRQYGGIPPYPETREYVRRVLLAWLLDGVSPQLQARLTVSRFSAAGSALPQPPARDPLRQLAEIRAEREAALAHPEAYPPAAGLK
jgi:transglycosylase-like protein with SLT domain